MKRALFTTAIAGLLAASASAGVIYVDGAAAGANDGTSWADALSDLHDAIDDASAGDEIWVAQGVYKPSTTDASVSFALKSGVALYGGFSGEETEREQCDWRTKVTTLSGDVGGDDVFNGTSWTRMGFNSGHVLDATDTDSSAVIDGFTISQGALGPSGTGATSPLMSGGAIYMLRSDATVRHCRFLSNQGAFSRGGAVFVYDGSPEFDGCSFEYNTGHLTDGAGLYTGGNGQPFVHDCLFLGNSLTFDGVDNVGGGWFNDCAMPVTALRCRFEDNRVNPFFVYNGVGYGGGFMSFLGGCTVIDCEFINNRAPSGGGMITWGPSTIVNCLFVGNTAYEQPGSGGIDTGGLGGGLATYSFQTPAIDIINCTFTRNHADKGAGFYGISNATPTLTNCILWDNVATAPGVVGYSRAEAGGNFDLRYCDIRGIFGPPEQGEDVPDPENYETCLDIDPMFADSAEGDYSLDALSSLIDAGDSTAVPMYVLADLAGNARFFDDPMAPNTGVLDARGAIDFGAYEAQPASTLCPGDCDGSGTVDFNDLVSMLFQFGQPTPPLGCDADASGGVDFNDLVSALFVFGPCNEAEVP